MTPRFDAEVRPHWRGWLGTVEVSDGVRVSAFAETEEDLLDALKRAVCRHTGMALTTFELQKRSVASVRPSWTPLQRPQETAAEAPFPRAPRPAGSAATSTPKSRLASRLESALDGWRRGAGRRET